MSRRADERPYGIGPRLTLVLAAALVIPFFVKISLGHEPYPAAILPEGGSRLTTSNGTVAYEVTALFARDARGELVEVDAERFLDPIPFHYLRYLGRNEYALADLGDHHIRLRGTDLTFDLPRHDPTEAERSEIVDWLRGRLGEQGYEDDVLVIRELEHRTDVDTGDIVSVRVVSEASLDL